MRRPSAKSRASSLRMRNWILKMASDGEPALERANLFGARSSDRAAARARGVRRIATSTRCCGIHLSKAIEPILSSPKGKKTADESAVSPNCHALLKQVSGDVIILKRSSGPVEGLCTVSDAWFYRLQPDTWPDIERYARALCMDDSSFWKEKRAASYASLMRIERTVRVPDPVGGKLDPRGWVSSVAA